MAKCHNCRNCYIACKDEHVGNAYPGYAAPQPRHGHDWIAISTRERGAAPMVDVAHLPTTCNHCEDAPCVTASPDGPVYLVSTPDDRFVYAALYDGVGVQQLQSIRLAPVLENLSPASVTAGSGDVVLTVNGAHFYAESKVLCAAKIAAKCRMDLDEVYVMEGGCRAPSCVPGYANLTVVGASQVVTGLTSDVK